MGGGDRRGRGARRRAAALHRLPAKLPGTVKELKDQRVEPSTVLRAVAVSVVSLAGGASLGPEDALGKMGGGLGTWVSERRARRGHSCDEHAQRDGRRVRRPLVVARPGVDPHARDRASQGTALRGHAGRGPAVRVGRVRRVLPDRGVDLRRALRLPSYKYEDWQLLAAIPLGLVAGALALITVIAVAGVSRLAAGLGNRTILRATIGGVAFGLVGVALPLTLFTGTDQLDTVIQDGAALGAGLLIAVVFAKILVFAVCEATGFIGGPFLVMLFIGGTAGTASPRADPGASRGAGIHRDVRRPSRGARRRPVLADPAGALTTQIGTLQIAPVVIAVLTAYLAVSGSGMLMALATAPASPPRPARRRHPAPPRPPSRPRRREAARLPAGGCPGKS